MFNYMNRVLAVMFLMLFALMAGCRSPEPVVVPEPDPGPDDKIAAAFAESEIFDRGLTGFYLYDPESKTALFDKEGHRYFTPASNTKIFTLYASLKVLPDTLPSLRYTMRDDTLYFRGTGNPAFLNPEFDSQKTFQFLKNSDRTLAYYDGHFLDEPFGSGWAWNWYMAAYAPEKAPFPIYGNMVRFNTEQVVLVKLDDEQPVDPPFFEKYLDKVEWNSDQIQLIDRERFENHFRYAPRTDTARQVRQVPFVYDRDLFMEILADTLGRDIVAVDNPIAAFDQTLYGTPAEPLYQRMMKESDNLIAEQLLLMISDELNGTLSSSEAIESVIGQYFHFLPDAPRWADGSGLTRYNLFTPRSIAILLDRLFEEYGEELTLSRFPAGGQSGTLSGWYRPEEGEPPYLYAKTGTLRNNITLSGYIYTDSGNRLIFSFMNNNQVASANQVRSEMQRVLNLVKELY